MKLQSITNFILDRTLFYSWWILQSSGYNIWQLSMYLIRHTPLSPKAPDNKLIWNWRITTIGSLNIGILVWYFAYALEVLEVWRYSLSNWLFWFLSVGIAIILLVFAQPVFLVFVSLIYSLVLRIIQLIIRK